MPTTDAGFTTGSSKVHAGGKPPIQLQRDRSLMYGGLCRNCERLETCTFPSTTSETWFCEEYSVAKAPEQNLPVIDSLVDEVADAKLGLCVNCEVRGTCKLSKPIGGMWFCNEYQ